MVEDFVLSYAKLLVENPKKVKVSSIISKKDNSKTIDIFVEEQDIGKIIGKNAKTVCSLKDFVSIYKMKDNLKYKINVKPIS